MKLNCCHFASPILSSLRIHSTYPSNWRWSRFGISRFLELGLLQRRRTCWSNRIRTFHPSTNNPPHIYTVCPFYTCSLSHFLLLHNHTRTPKHPHWIFSSIYSCICYSPLPRTSCTCLNSCPKTHSLYNYNLSRILFQSIQIESKQSSTSAKQTPISSDPLHRAQPQKTKIFTCRSNFFRGNLANIPFQINNLPRQLAGHQANISQPWSYSTGMVAPA